MTLLSNSEIEILKTHLANLKKEKKTLKHVLNTIAKQYQHQYKLLNEIVQCQENIEDYKKQYYIITTYNKDIGSHLLKQIDQKYPTTKMTLFQKIQKNIINKSFLKKHIYNYNN
jgi:archaellum component FlaC